MGVYRTYNNRVVPKSDGISQRMIRNECKYLFEALTTGLSALRLAISSLLSRPPVIHPFGTLAVFRQVKRRDPWSSGISPLLNPYETRLTDCLIMTERVAKIGT